jgi:uncharacterized protein
LIFVDTTIWVSGLDTADSLHEDGRAVLEALIDESLSPALTTDFVLDETLTLLRRRGARSEVVVKALENILASSLVRVVYVEETLFLEAQFHGCGDDGSDATLQNQGDLLPRQGL